MNPRNWVRAPIRRFPRTSLVIFFAVLVGLEIGVALIAVQSPIRNTPTWIAATTTAVALGAFSTVPWFLAIRQPARSFRQLQRWLWITCLAWIISIMTTVVVVKTQWQPADPYTIAALWYQVTAFVGTVIVFAKDPLRLARRPGGPETNAGS